MGQRLSSFTTSIVEPNFNYRPSFSDVIKTYILLCRYSKRNSKGDILFLPPEIILQMLDFAGYIPQTTITNQQNIAGSNNQNQLYLSQCMKKMRYFSPCRIEIIVESKDQGWSSYPNTQGIRNSHTWGEITLSNSNERYEVYRNIHAGKEYEIQAKIYDKTSDLLISLKSNLDTPIGDGMLDYSQPYPTAPSVQLYIRSLYPGWANKVKNAKIKIDWEFKDNWNEIII
jgi:hypothetical protein